MLIAGAVASTWLVREKANVHLDRDVCATLRPHDDLVHLASRAIEREAAAQLSRWRGCDDIRTRRGERTLIAEAKATLPYDYVLIGVLAVVVFVASWVMHRQRRWRLAAAAGMVLAVVYAAADVGEDFGLHRLLGPSQDWSTLLPIASAVKWGALVAALPLVGGALFVVCFGEPANDVADRCAPRGDRRFVSRWSRRLRHGSADPIAVGTETPPPGIAPPDSGAAPPDPPPNPVDTDHGGLGICCSGGGIRSAAFCLGALQALDTVDETSTPSEVSRARWLFSVSGGSYISAAWATARAAHPDGEPRPWARGTFEEQYLRRHASYLAPGLAGKAWALIWFLLAFLANAGLVALTIGAVFLPAGWVVHTGVRPRLVDRGDVTLPEGGCIRLADGAFLAVLAGTTLHLTPGSHVLVGRGAVIEPVKSATGKASATVEGAPPLSAVAIVGQPVTTATTAVASGTSPQQTVTCPATGAPGDAGTGLPSDAPGRLFEKGTTLPIRPGPDVQVQTSGNRVTGCVSDLPGDCTPALAVQRVVQRGSVLAGAPAAQLVLRTDAIVSERGEPRLEQACDAAPCSRFALRPGLQRVVPISLLVLAVCGLALVTMREDPTARETLARWTKRLALATGAIIVSLWLFPHLVVSAHRGRSVLEHATGVVSGASGGTILLALVSQLWASSAKATTPTGKVQGVLKSIGGRLRPIVVRLAAVVAGPLLLVLTAILFAAYGAAPNRQYLQITVALGMTGWLVIFGSCGDLNRWSLHPYYRDRLRSGFAVDRQSGAVRDDALAQLVATDHSPPLTLCATANLADAQITPPGRPAVPWTFSAEQMGSCPGTGCHVPADMPPRFEYLAKVWTAVAVSGAAFSPAMGKMSRPERVLFALGNLRLGLWYPNPLYLNAKDDPSADFDPSWYDWHHPRLWYLFKEAFGLHRLRDPWVYVTDGGHYENLGLVELLRTKECTEVYCFDAAGDSTRTFGTFADAMRLAREEHQIDIKLDPRAMAADDDGVSKVGIWAGTVTYPSGSSGWLVVAKLAVPLSAPFDIVDLARTLPSFPTNPTADQLYTDQKFEAYRALGEHLGREAAAAGTTLRKLVARGLSPEVAVAALNEELCRRHDPHPCPPPKAGTGKSTSKGDGKL